LIDMHGGSVMAESDGDGNGSVFTVRLPLTINNIDELEVMKRGKVIAPGSRIALVEDNDDSREMLAMLLTRSGFEVRTAADGLTAVDLINAFAPHAALVDVGLPGIDGFEVARRVRTSSTSQNVTMIALTGYGQQSDRATAIKAGFDAHLVKPVRLEQLLAIIASHEREPRSATNLSSPAMTVDGANQ
jgi:two-component system CheB/CheR fusion protein